MVPGVYRTQMRLFDKIEEEGVRVGLIRCCGDCVSVAAILAAQGSCDRCWRDNVSLQFDVRREAER